MPTYITLLRYTQKGIENIREHPYRVEKAQDAVKAYGGELKALYLTMGHYDEVAILEMPDDASYARFTLGTSSHGWVRTETLRGFTSEEWRDIIAGLPPQDAPQKAVRKSLLPQISVSPSGEVS